MSDAAARARKVRLQNKAVRILALRDHSEGELRRKLTLSAERSAAYAREASEQEEPFTAEEIEQAIAWCHQQNWLDDARFAERYIAGRSRKGYGPQRIRLELGQKGIEKALIEDALSATEIDWQAEALRLAERKFGLPLPTAWAEKAKVQRYLMSKGFFMEDIHAIFANFDV